jgi:hypothetical protein
MFWLYLIVALLWGWLSVVVQVQLEPTTDSRKLQVGFAINTLLCPLSILFAIYRHLSGHYVVTRAE